MKTSRSLLGLFGLLATSILAPSAGAATWTSYLALEIPNGAGGLTAQALYEVTYNTNLFADPARITGADLLECIFGTATDDGTYTDGFGGSYQHSTAGSATDSVGYLDFFGSPFIENLTIAGTTFAQDLDYDPSWSYFAAGGSGDNGGGIGVPGPYGTGAFGYANDGLATRYLGDGSFDAWVLTGFDQSFNPLDAPSLSPSPGAFANATVILHGAPAVPEPSRVMLLVIGLAAGLLRRSR